MHDIESKMGPPNAPARVIRKLNPGVPTFIISDCERPSDLVALMEEVTGLWADGVEHLYLEFITVNRMAPNSALLIYDLLKRKPPETTITAKAHSPIIGPGVLVWLAADRRYLRRTAWFYLRSPHADGWCRPCPPSDRGESWKHDTFAMPDLAEMDYRTVLRLIREHLPISDLEGKVLTPALLDEFGLLDPELLRQTRPNQRDGGAKPSLAETVISGW